MVGKVYPTEEIYARNEIAMKSNDVIHQVPPEFLHILSLAFAFYKLRPRGEQIFERDDSVVGTRFNTQ